jgi:hypothetical protein
VTARTRNQQQSAGINNEPVLAARRGSGYPRSMIVWPLALLFCLIAPHVAARQAVRNVFSQWFQSIPSFLCEPCGAAASRRACIFVVAYNPSRDLHRNAA